MTILDSLLCRICCSHLVSYSDLHYLSGHRIPAALGWRCRPYTNRGDYYFHPLEHNELANIISAYVIHVDALGFYALVVQEVLRD